ncbi:hypothetical protein LJE71_18575 [Xanthobacter autotrophicus]|uniref:DUF6212 domain-containing protein n=1 Tax=Xanthobacter autotrophicus TaxID=280 RepID=UPI001E298C5C|nr:DUF6212 domain-containing protein [Xanthobacter autotrophicus]UDQ88253.1 hypothetical protein LJE71_18575 [Xanthobacter autotrophicus]
MSQLILAVDKDVPEATFARLSRVARTLKIDVDDILAQKEIVVSGRVRGKGLTSPFLAGVLLSGARRVERATIVRHFQSLLPRFDEGRISFDGDLTDNLESWALSARNDLLEKILEQAARAERESASLRVMYEKAQQALHDLDRAPERKVTSRLLFQAILGPRATRLGSEPLAVSLRREHQAIASVDFHFVKTVSPLIGALVELTLAGSRTGRSFATWRVLEEALVPGWNRFHCPIRDEPFGEGVTFTIRALSPDGRIDLSESADREPSGVTVFPERRAAPAMRVWSTQLGLARTRPEGGHWPLGSAAEKRPAPASRADLLQLASPVTPEGWEGQSRWDEWLQGLMVHPDGTTPVVVAVAGLEASDLRSVRVACKLSHELAVPTNFTAWVRPATARHSAAPLAASTDSGAGLMGSLWRRIVRSTAVEIPEDVSWLTLTAEQEGEVSFDLPEPLSGRFDLFLATSNLDRRNDYAWATFTDIRFGTGHG